MPRAGARGPRRTLPQAHQTPHIAALPATMAIEDPLAAIDEEGGGLLLMQGTQSGNLVAAVVARRLPAALFQIAQKGNRAIDPHAGLGSSIRIRAAARQSQARMVGR